MKGSEGRGPPNNTAPSLSLPRWRRVGTGLLPPAGGGWEGGNPVAPFSARGRVWEGAALTQGDGETRFPHPPHPVFRGGQNVWAQTGVMALGCAGWPSPPSPLPHTGEG